MSEDSGDQTLQAGHDCAMMALSAQRTKVAALPADDQLQWWIGFVTAAMGAAQATLGESAVRALRRSLMDETDAQEAATAVALLRFHAQGEPQAVTGDHSTPAKTKDRS